MRLIDADNFKNLVTAISLANRYDLGFVNEFCKLIDSCPTAYDVDKVVEQLEASGTDDDGIVCYVDKKPVVTKELAIKTVKSGGIE